MMLSEFSIEEATLSWFQELGWNILHGSDIAPGEPHAERNNYQEAILPQRFSDAIVQLNPDIPIEALEEAFRKVIHPDYPSLLANNRNRTYAVLYSCKYKNHSILRTYNFELLILAS